MMSDTDYVTVTLPYNEYVRLRASACEAKEAAEKARKQLAQAILGTLEVEGFNPAIGALANPARLLTDIKVAMRAIVGDE